MCQAESKQQNRTPEIEEAGLAQELFVTEERRKRRRPEGRAVVAREDHDERGDDQTFGGTIEIAEEQGVGVVCLPGREEHGQCGDERGESTEAC